MQDLKDFLVEAKRQTYANASVKKVPSSRLGSSDYEYKNDTYTYHDTYFGGTKFMGTEVVYHNDDIPIWGMNYYGISLDESLSEEAMDKALRPALMQVGQTDILPLRGPKIFEHEEYRYTFDIKGDLEGFEGVEVITKAGTPIYTLKCVGGIIKR